MTNHQEDSRQRQPPELGGSVTGAPGLGRRTPRQHLYRGCTCALGNGIVTLWPRSPSAAMRLSTWAFGAGEVLQASETPLTRGDDGPPARHNGKRLDHHAHRSCLLRAAFFLRLLRVLQHWHRSLRLLVRRHHLVVVVPAVGWLMARHGDGQDGVVELWVTVALGYMSAHEGQHR